MNEILNKIRLVDPNDSDAAKEVVTAFFQSLAKTSGFECSKWLRSLVYVINRYPRFCMSHRNTAENFIIKYLESKNYNNVIEAAKSAHSLQQVRPSQEKDATPKSCWREQMSTLCYAAHKLISALFTKSVDLYQNGDNLELHSLVNSPLSKALLKLNKVSNTTTEGNKLALLSTRIRNIFVFIQAMLVESYPVAKAIRPQEILDVIVRTLSVTSSKNIGNTHNLADVCMIKIQALRTLDALGACLGSNLLPYSALVIRLPMQTLRWSSENVSEDTRKVRCAAYQSVSRWLTVLRASSDGGRWHDEITTHVLDDVITREDTPVTITAQPSLKNLSKKAKRKLQNTMLQQSTLATHMSTEKNKIQCSDKIDDSVALVALDCAETFLTVCGAFLKPIIHKQFHERIVRECYTLKSHDRRCLALLRVLDAARRSCRNVPPPTQYCLALYSRLVNSGNEEVTKICLQAIQEIRLHLHCSPPSLNFALEPRKEDTTTKNTNKTISERNRAALEALLGNIKLPEKSDLDEEPVPKRSKLTNEDITEQISLSSDSGKSVIISDDSDIETTEDIELVEAVEHSGDFKELNKEPVISEQSNHLTDNQPNDSIDQNIPIIETKIQSFNIFEAKTQLPVNESNDADESNITLSNEVGYDLPNTGTTKVLEKMEDENLPSTNETDDIQITCGQVVKSSQDGDANKILETCPKVNGFSKSPEKEIEEENLVSVKTDTEKEAVSVDDMLADFVDEVNDNIDVEL